MTRTHPGRLFAAAVVVASVTVSASAAEAPLLQADFQADPQAGGWTFRGRGPDAGTALWKTDPNSENRYLASPPSRHRGGWDSPALPVAPGQYYRVTYRSRGGKSAFVGAVFQDANGRELPADHYSSTDPAETWADRSFVFRAKQGAATVRLRFRGIDGATLDFDDVSVRGVTPEEARKWADALYAEMPPLKYTPPAGRWGRIPETIAKLKAGKPVRILMLGDSIVNDTGNSIWELQLTRAYPKAPTVITSVRGGTGCGYYRREGRIRKWVLDYEPDLVIIGGICNRQAAYVRDVIEQLRAADAASEKLDMEILVLSGAYGFHYHEGVPARWREQERKRREKYHAELTKMVGEVGVEFLDMRKATEAYFQGAGRPVMSFMRDNTHPNERGRQVIGRILARYLMP